MTAPSSDGRRATWSSINTSTMTFSVHSTFRDENNCKLKPHGLEWDLPGISEVFYVPYPPISTSANDETPSEIDLTSPQVRRGIVEAHNLWSFAKDLPFVSTDDILHLTKCVGEGGQEHFAVDWKSNRRAQRITRYGGTITETLQNDESSKSGDAEQAEVWINGKFCSVVSGPDTLQPILDAIDVTYSKKVCFRRSDNLIRIERFFHGLIRGEEVFDHLMDNLYAMEDPEIVDEQTIVGTVTLPDWIMGGMLTSRLWIQELDDGNMLALRPLKNDDLKSSDRRYELIKGKDDHKIDLVRKEMERLRFLALLEHPGGHKIDGDGVDESRHLEIESSVRRQHRINRRRRRMRL